MFPLGLSPRKWPAICFIEIRPIPFFQQASIALFSGDSLSSQGVYWSMIASTIPPSAAAWISAARSLWWVEMPTSRALPDFLIASTVLRQLAALEHGDGVVRLWLSPKLWMKNRST